jgi:hypothetical protein
MLPPLFFIHMVLSFKSLFRFMKHHQLFPTSSFASLISNSWVLAQSNMEWIFPFTGVKSRQYGKFYSPLPPPPHGFKVAVPPETGFHVWVGKICTFCVWSPTVFTHFYYFVVTKILNNNFYNSSNEKLTDFSWFPWKPLVVEALESFWKIGLDAY